MPYIESTPAIHEVLDEVRWFSFQQGWESETRLTIWQAIAHIMMKSGPANQALQEYKKAIEDAENELFDELCKLSDVGNRLAYEAMNEKYPVIRKANRIKAAKELSDWLPLLEKNRLVTTENFGTPAILYQVILSEAHPDRKGCLDVAQSTPPAPISPQLLIGRRSLNDWTAAPSLSILGLIGAAEKVSARAVRSQAFESHEKIIAMFMHLLSELFPNDFTARGQPDRLKMDRFVKLLVGNATYRESGFPQESTCASILENSEKEYATIHRKHQLGLPEKGYPRLRAHIKNLPKPQ